jgi:hypothetical protein
MNSSINRQLIIIAPTCPPGVCGVSDHAYKTALALGKYYGSVKIGVEYFPSLIPDTPLPITTAYWHQLLNQLKKSKIPADVLLNYTPTSYARSGFPLKLLSALKKLKKGSADNHLFVFIHETWDGSTNLKMHHRLRNLFIKNTIKQISEIADGITVVTNEQKQKIEAITFKPKIRLSLVGANILPFDKAYGLNSTRTPGDWLIFGLAHTRLWTLQQHLNLIKELQSKGVIKRIYAIGPKDNTFSDQEQALANSKFGPGFLIQMGTLVAEEVSKMMLNAEAALVGQTADSLRKSGTFAALSAHAVPVICEAPITLDEPPGYAIIRPDELRGNNELISSTEGEKRRQLLHQWFWLTRSWEAIALDMHTWIRAN